jgi:Zn-dependent peptidase ImmA (M78 family)
LPSINGRKIVATTYLAKFRSRADIAQSANGMRLRLGIANFYVFNIVNQIRTKMIGKYFNVIGYMQLILFDDKTHPDSKAFINYGNGEFFLNVHEEIWELAEMGEPMSRFILAHEIGHITLHENYRLEFTTIDEEQLSFFPEERGCEWQANCFAGNFLAPATLLNTKITANELSRQFDFPLDYAYDYRNCPGS